MGNLLILPMAFYVFYIFMLGVLNFRVRKAAIQAGELDSNYFKCFTGTVSDRVTIVGRHFDNQFQVPLLFFVTCAIAMNLGKADLLTLLLAWGFVASRLAHSYIHLGRNRILPRALSFGTGLFLVLAMWSQLTYLAL